MSAFEITHQTKESDAISSDYSIVYDPRAIKLVVDGYNAILAALAEAKKIGRLPRGKLLVEVVHSSSWTIPNLMDTVEFERFQEFSVKYMPEGVLRAIWHILKESCGETQLIPAVSLNTSNGMPVVKLV